MAWAQQQAHPSSLQKKEMKELVIVHGGELAKDVAEQIVVKKPPSSSVKVSLRCASQRPKPLTDFSNDTLVCFVMQTIENAAPTEEESTLVLIC